MDLKGCLADRIPEEKKAKMLETLKRMENTRREDDMYLRDEINKKINETLEEREETKAALVNLETEFNRKAQELQKTFNEQMAKTSTKLVKLGGAIEALRAIIEVDKDESTKEVVV